MADRGRPGDAQAGADAISRFAKGVERVLACGRFFVDHPSLPRAAERGQAAIYLLEPDRVIAVFAILRIRSGPSRRKRCVVSTQKTSRW